MTRMFKITIVSLAVIAGASAAQAGSYGSHGGKSGVENFDINKYWVEQSLFGG